MCKAMKHVEGKNLGEIKLYALSTCLWCLRTKKLLDQLGVSYHYIDVDLQNDEDKKKSMETITQCNRLGSFPTIIINDKCIIGYREKDIKETLGYDS